MAIASDPFPPTAPIEIPATPRLRDAFTALSVRNFRRYALALGVGNTAGWAQRVAIDWLVLELTGNIALVGLTVAVQFIPGTLLAAYGGVIADRFSRRKLIILTQAIIAALSGVLAVGAISGLANLWFVYAMVFGIGVAQAFEGPARAAFVGEVAGSQLRSAVSLGASLFHLGALIGPAISAVLIVAVGSGWSIAINAFAILFGIFILATLRTDELYRLPPAPKSAGQIREGLRYIARKGTLRWTMVTMIVVATIGTSLPTLFTGLARDTETGAAGLGAFNSLAAVGSLIGALAAARSTALRVRGVVFASISYGVVLMATGIAPSFWMLMPLLIVVGFTRLFCVILAESLVQLSTNPALRGRVLSIWWVLWLGGQAIGGPLVGGIAELVGSQLAIAICGALVLVVTCVIAIYLARSGKLRVRLVWTGRWLRPVIASHSGARDLGSDEYRDSGAGKDVDSGDNAGDAGAGGADQTAGR